MPEAPFPEDDDVGESASAPTRVDAIVRAMVEVRKGIAALQARELRLLADAAALAYAEMELAPPGRRTDLAFRAIAADIAAALRASDRTIQRRMEEASVLAADFPATVASLAAGRIERAHVLDVLALGGTISGSGARAAFEAAALEVAERETPARTRPVLRLLAHRLDPVPFEERHARAREQRRVWIDEGDDGMADVIARVPALQAHAVLDRLSQFARGALESHGRGANDGATPAGRSVHQVRADVFVDLLLTGHATPEISNASRPESESIVARVQVTVPAGLLTGAVPVSDGAEFDGVGPLPREDARRLAGAAPGWDRLFVDSACRAVRGVDRYRPSEEQRRLLRIRDAHCRFPGCRMPVSKTDLDHTEDAARGGATTITNLAHLCRRHHVMKHQTAWIVRQRADGTLVWTSPTGRVHLDVPHRMLAPGPAPHRRLPGEQADTGPPHEGSPHRSDGS